MNTILQTCVQDSSWRENKGSHEKSSLSGVHYDNRIEEVKPKKHGTMHPTNAWALSDLITLKKANVDSSSILSMLPTQVSLRSWERSYPSTNSGGGVKMSWLPASCWLLLRINVGRKQQQPRHWDLSNVNVLYWWMLTLWALSDVEPSCKALSLHHLRWQNLDSLSIHNSKSAAHP